MIASFTTIYLPTLATFGTLFALLTVYFARKDRREEVVDAWLDGFRRQQERVAEAVVELADVTRRDLIEKKEGNILWEPAGNGMSPPVMRVPRMKLKAALAGLPSGGLTFPVCHALVTASQADVIANADAALDEVTESVNRLAQDSAKRRSSLSHGVIRKWRTRRAWRKRGVGDPYS
jgi:hypothetical protein